MSLCSEFDRAPLGDVVLFINGDRSTNYPKGGDYVETGIPFISAADLSDGQINQASVRRISDVAYERLRSGKIQPSDALFCLRGSIGKAAYVKEDESGAIASSLVIIRATERIDSRFLFFFLTSRSGQQAAAGLNNGAAQPNLSVSELQNVEIPLPPLPIQRRIAGILSAYDDLIENSQRRIKILEEMARRLYREWFVHFRFPGHEDCTFVESPLGEIPEGWEVKRLGEIVENFDRLRKPLSKIQRADMKGEYPYYGAAKVFDFVNDFIFDGEYLLMAEDGSVITPERRPVLQLANEKFWPNNHTHVLRGKPPFSTHFFYLGLLEVDISPYITGAAQPKITQENMNRIPFFCGPSNLHEKFNGLVAPMILQSQNIHRQIQNLRRTRDLLLPHLLSGQIDVEALPEPGLNAIKPLE